MRRRTGTVLVVAGLMHAAPVRADRAPQGVSLRWTRDAGARECISATRLRERVREHVGRDPFVRERGAPIAIEGRIRRAPDPPRWRVRFVVRDENGRVRGRRRIREDVADCRRLDEALTLVIALLVEPEDAGERPAVSPSSPRNGHRPQAGGAARRAASPGREPDASPTPPTTRQEQAGGAEASRGDRWSLRVEAGTAAEIGLLPGLAWGVVAAVQLEPPWDVPLRLDGGLWPRSVARGGGGSATFRMGSLGIAACPRIGHWSPIRLAACGGVETAWLDVDAQGYVRPRSPRRTVVSLRAAGRVSAELDRFFAALQIGVGVPLQRDRFYVAQQSGRSDVGLHRPATVTGRFELLLGLHIL